MRAAAPGLQRYGLATLCGVDRPGQSEALRSAAQAATGRPPAALLTLFVADLLAPDAAGMAASNHRVTADDMAAFAPGIAAFVETLQGGGD